MGISSMCMMGGLRDVKAIAQKAGLGSRVPSGPPGERPHAKRSKTAWSLPAISTSDSNPKRTMGPSLLLLVLVTASVGTAQACELNEQRAALERFYNAYGGPYWSRNRLWLTPNSASCTIPVPIQGGTASDETGFIQVPMPSDASYCCWEGVTCCAGIPTCTANSTESCCSDLV